MSAPRNVPAEPRVPAAAHASATTGPRAPSPRSKADARSSTVEELRLLDLAGGAVESDPELALRLAEEHARRFPSGLLGDEREVIEIAALVRLGRLRAARARAMIFLGAHPGSAYSAKVRVLTKLDD